MNSYVWGLENAVSTSLLLNFSWRLHFSPLGFWQESTLAWKIFWGYDSGQLRFCLGEVILLGFFYYFVGYIWLFLIISVTLLSYCIDPGFLVWSSRISSSKLVDFYSTSCNCSHRLFTSFFGFFASFFTTCSLSATFFMIIWFQNYAFHFLV